MSLKRGAFGVRRWVASSGGSAPGAPTANAATGTGQTDCTANWSPSTGATEYRLDLSTSIDFTSYVTGYQNKILGDVSSLYVSGLSAATTYYYRVRAVNAYGTSGSSNTRSVTTQATNEVPTGHFVSKTGSATWAESTNVATPCSPATAFANGSAGDSIYWLDTAGIYHPAATTGDSPALPAYRPANSGTAGNPITHRAYPGHTPTISAYASIGPSGQHSDFCFGVVDKNYVTFDGFTCVGDDGHAMGGVYLWHATGVTLRNLTSDGGDFTQTTHDNCDLIRIEYCTDITVQNCTLKNFTNVDNYANTAGIKLYHNTHATGLSFGYSDVYGGIVIENSEFFGGVAPIYVKSSTDDLVIRGVFIHDCVYGVHVTPSLAVMQSDRGTLSNSLIVNITFSAGFDCNDDNGGFHGNDWVVYNTTFYNCAGGAFAFSTAEAGHGWKYYNNLSHNSPATFDLSGQVLSTCLLAEEDHNQWGTGSIGFEMGRNEGYHRYYSLATWQASTELEGGGHPGANDLASDPLFANGSGTLALKADFALQAGSPCKGAGRGGVDMGCDVSTVGVL